jgi:energy-coupling factor transporter transmembrane protein EcfT
LFELIKLLSVLFLLFHVSSFQLTENILLFLILFSLLSYFKFEILKFLYKLKYLIVSIFLIYPLSIPGEIVFSIGVIQFTQEGILIGLSQVIKLLNLFFIARIYTLKTNNSDVINSVMYFVYPLKFMSINVKKIHKMIFLSFEYFYLLNERNINLKKPIFTLSSLLNDTTKLKASVPSLKINLFGYFYISLFVISIIMSL